MTPRIPVELAQARETRDIIWRDYSVAIDEGRPQETIKLLGDTGVKMDELCQEWYNRWQAVGGTSDIVSIVDAEEQKRQSAEIAADNEWLGAPAYGGADLTKRRMIVTSSFAERWTDNPDHYRERFGIDNVEVKR